MPWPATTYMRRAMTTSRQPRPHPQVTGTAATSARNGTATNTARATFSHPALGSGSTTGSAARAGAGAAAGTSGTMVVALGGGVMAILGFGRKELRHRNLRKRRLPYLGVDVHHPCARRAPRLTDWQHTGTPD